VWFSIFLDVPEVVFLKFVLDYLQFFSTFSLKTFENFYLLWARFNFILGEKSVEVNEKIKLSFLSIRKRW